MPENLSKNLEETYKIASDFVESVFPKKDSAFIVGLYGDLGSGKTTFVKGVAKKLRLEENITSPTFVMEKIYKISHSFFEHLVHIDAYRIESEKEIESLGWQEVSADPKNLILVEWPEKISKVIPSDHAKIHFEFVDENTRRINFNK